MLYTIHYHPSIKIIKYSAPFMDILDMFHQRLQQLATIPSHRGSDPLAALQVVWTVGTSPWPSVDIHFPGKHVSNTRSSTSRLHESMD